MLEAPRAPPPSPTLANKCATDFVRIDDAFSMQQVFRQVPGSFYNPRVHASETNWRPHEPMYGTLTKERRRLIEFIQDKMKREVSVFFSTEPLRWSSGIPCAETIKNAQLPSRAF